MKGASEPISMTSTDVERTIHGSTSATVSTPSAGLVTNSLERYDLLIEGSSRVGIEAFLLKTMLKENLEVYFF
jgi:hypothetical protein